MQLPDYQGFAAQILDKFRRQEEGSPLSALPVALAGLSREAPIRGLVQPRTLSNRPTSRFVPQSVIALQRSIRPPQHELAQRVSKDDLASRAVGRLYADLIRRGGLGSPVDPTLRSRLEGHLNFDLSTARLHYGTAAATAAAELDARAFTIAHDIFLGSSMYPPETTEAIGVLAHELTHVGQQTGRGGRLAMQLFTPQGGDILEREAQATEQRVRVAVAGPSRPGMAFARLSPRAPMTALAPVQRRMGDLPATEQNAEASALTVQRDGRAPLRQRPDVKKIANLVYLRLQQKLAQDRRRATGFN